MCPQAEIWNPGDITQSEDGLLWKCSRFPDRTGELGTFFYTFANSYPYPEAEMERKFGKLTRVRVIPE